MKRAPLVLFGLLACGMARADSANFDLSGKLYTKWLYRNNASMGVLSYGNPFWTENFSGDNGVGSEFELGIKGRVSDVVEAGVRIKSRFGSTWHDFWENGNLRYESPNTSGESLGMDHAEYMKLRGYWVRLMNPLPGVSEVLVGSSDLSMFNAWTVGKIRYIDRDNAKGIFVRGEPLGETLGYHLGVIALPKLWVGPGWSTGLGEELYPDSKLIDPFWTQDWAYALKLESSPFDWLRLEFIGMVSVDSEADLYDPDALGTLNPPDPQYCYEHPDDSSRCPDHNVDLATRYTNAVLTLAGEAEATDDVVVNFLGGFSLSDINPTYAGNGVAQNQGVYPMIWGDVHDYAAVVRLTMMDAFGVEDLGIKAEGFYIGQHWTSTFGARREDDVLLTDGFIEGGQLPTLNIANEFMDFDEAFYESCIGWQGGTLVLEYLIGELSLKAEGTFIGYNTNAQNRRVYDCDNCLGDPVYPSFLYTDGYTDTDLWDYANPKSIDRGRDPRSVYREDQDRHTIIAVLWANYRLDVGRGIELDGKFKMIFDRDGRDTSRSDDDYRGDIYTGRFSAAYPVLDTLKVRLGMQFDWWDEQNRDGSPSRGYAWYQTTKVKPFLQLSFTYGGATLRYHLEYLYKDQWRGERDPEQFWG
ncbi:MAG: hypothetical protein D6806_16250, partial [Deltaproteobacteria bacterium]